MTPDHVLSTVDSVMSRPFEWGACDCCSAACAVFARLWGVDPMAPVRGYGGQFGAARLTVRGLDRLAVTLADRAGLEDGHAIGGLALSCDGRSLLVCVEPGLWAGKTEHGYALLRSAGRGWHLA